MGRFDDYTIMGGSKRYFQPTIWTMIGDIGCTDGEKHRAAIEQLGELYWKPVYCWLRRRGYNNEDAKDLTQDFFLSGLEKQRFERADPARGRFRNFLLRCLANFVSNKERDEKARGRRPSKPILSIDQFDTNEMRIELFHTDTPEDSYDRAWFYDLLLRVMGLLKAECIDTGKESHYELFVRRIIEPILEETLQPAIKELAEEMGLPRKRASNYIVTARRAYHRLLREAIREYASSDEEVTLEIEDLFKFVAGRKLL